MFGGIKIGGGKMEKEEAGFKMEREEEPTKQKPEIDNRYCLICE